MKKRSMTAAADQSLTLSCLGFEAVQIGFRKAAPILPHVSLFPIDAPLHQGAAKDHGQLPYDIFRGQMCIRDRTMFPVLI